MATGLEQELRQARWFYALILVSTGVGVALDFIGINPVKALYWTAVINGLLAPFLIVAILIVAADKKLMQGQPSSRLGWIVVAITTVAMFVAGLRCLLCRPPLAISRRVSNCAQTRSGSRVSLTMAQYAAFKSSRPDRHNQSGNRRMIGKESL